MQSCLRILWTDTERKPWRCFGRSHWLFRYCTFGAFCTFCQFSILTYKSLLCQRLAVVGVTRNMCSGILWALCVNGSRGWQTNLLPVSSFSVYAAWSLAKHKFKYEIIQNVKTTAEHFNKGRFLPSAEPWMTAEVHAHDIDPESRCSSLKFISVFWSRACFQNNVPREGLRVAGQRQP